MTLAWPSLHAKKLNGSFTLTRALSRSVPPNRSTQPLPRRSTTRGAGVPLSSNSPRTFPRYHAEKTWGSRVLSASAHPERDFLALEVWVPGIAKLISKAVEADVDNIRVIEADAAQALPIMLGDASLDEVWTFFPDPWRKARHRKRRLVSDNFALEIGRLLRDGGVWRLATDWDDYAWQMRDVIEACELFENPHAGERPDPEDPQPERGGFAPRFEGRVVTHFETRGIDAGRHAHDIVGVRRPRG